MSVRDDHTFTRISDDGYQLTILSLGIQLTVDRLRRDRQELVGELAVACDLAGARAVDGYLSVADFNLSSAHARTARAKLLAERSEADLDWSGFLEELCVRTINEYRRGSPARPLHTFDRVDSADAMLDVDGWPWLRDHAMLTFADGGGLKSYLALYGAGVLSRQGLRVGYVDWELSGHEHRERLDRLFGGDLPVIQYFRCDKPLTDEADRITREARRLSLEYLVFDSAGFGTAGPPEAAEHALAYFRAVRSIGLGSHHLAHVNRSDNGDQKPFGSSFWHNSARATWFAKLATATGDDGLTVGLYNRKSNLTRLSPAIGFHFQFAETRTTVTRVNVADVDELAESLPLWQRMKSSLTRGPQTLARLADDLGANVETLDRTVRRKGNLFTRVPSADGITRIGLVERRA